MDGIKGKVEKTSTDVVLLRAKVNDEIIPRLNGERKVRPVFSGTPMVGVPIPTDEALELKIISQEQYKELSPKFPWVVPYKTAVPGERYQDIYNALHEVYRNKTDESVAAKVNERYISDPRGIPEGTRIIIPVEKLEAGDSLRFYEKLEPSKKPGSSWP